MCMISHGNQWGLHISCSPRPEGSLSGSSAYLARSCGTLFARGGAFETEISKLKRGRCNAWPPQPAAAAGQALIVISQQRPPPAPAPATAGIPWQNAFLHGRAHVQCGSAPLALALARAQGCASTGGTQRLAGLHGRCGQLRLRSPPALIHRAGAHMCTQGFIGVPRAEHASTRTPQRLV